MFSSVILDSLFLFILKVFFTERSKPAYSGARNENLHFPALVLALGRNRLLFSTVLVHINALNVKTNLNFDQMSHIKLFFKCIMIKLTLYITICVQPWNLTFKCWQWMRRCLRKIVTFVKKILGKSFCSRARHMWAENHGN